MSTRRERSVRTPLPAGYVTLWTTVALDLVGFGIVVPILGRYAERFGANGFQVGLLFASFSLAQLVCAPLLGSLSDRIGRKPVIILSLVGTAIGSFITGAAATLPLLFLGRIVDGASGGSLAVAQAAVADISTPEQRPRLVGMLGAAFGVGFVLGPAIGGLSALGGPHVPFYVAGVIASINAVAATIRLPETRPADQQPRPPEAVSRLSGPASLDLRRLAVVGFITTLAFTGFEATFSLLGSARFDLTEGSAAVVFLGVGIVLVVMQGMAYGRLAERWGVGGVLRNGIVLIVVGLGALAIATHWSLLVVSLAMLAIGQGGASPAITTLVTERAPVDQRGQALGFQQSAYAVARVIGPPVAGLLFDHAGVGWPSLVGSLLCAVSLVLLLRWRLHESRPVLSAAGAS